MRIHYESGSATLERTEEKMNSLKIIRIEEKAEKRTRKPVEELCVGLHVHS
jgi:hypothetical protein